MPANAVVENVSSSSSSSSSLAGAVFEEGRALLGNFQIFCGGGAEEGALRCVGGWLLQA
jgi:hypothetical protein